MPTPNRILVVEDDPTLMMVASLNIHRVGIPFDGVTSGEHAVEAVRNTTYRLIFMDCGLPGITGYEAVRQIREIERKLRRIASVIIGTTAAGEPNECLSAGMNRFVLKPAPYRELARAYLSQPED